MSQPFATEPLVTVTELGTYLNDGSIDPDRAEMMIFDAMTLCAAHTAPDLLPDAASTVVRRVAARGYVSTLSTRQKQLTEAGSVFGGVAGGGCVLLDVDKADLDAVVRANSGVLPGDGRAFMVDLLPAGYAPVLSSWDTGIVGDPQQWT